MPKVSVIIPTKDRPKELENMLLSLSKQTFQDFEIIIVDGNKIPGGLVKQENYGLEKAKGEIFIRTDDDASAPPQWIEEIVKTFDSDLSIGGVTGPTVYIDMDKRDIFSLQDKLRGPFRWLYFNFIQEGNIDKICQVNRSGALTLGSNYPSALYAPQQEVGVHDCCTLAVRTDLLRQIGGFDDVYGSVGDFNETDVSFKVRDAGYKIIFNPHAWIFHLVSQSGVFDERANATADRVKNFKIFFHRWLKPNPRYYAYLFFMNLYYTYMFFKTKKMGYLRSWGASLW